jgi:hypothetical protein
LAVANYHEEFKCYPPPFLADADGRPMHSWRILLLPYLERNDVYKQYRFDEPWDGPNNRKLADQMPAQYTLHGCEKPGNVTTNYLRVVGDSTASPSGRSLNAGDIKDGVAHTLFIVENIDAGVHWMEPRDLSFDSMSFTISAPNGISSWLEPPAGVTLEGRVLSISPNMPPDAVKAAFTIAGAESEVLQKWLTAIADGRDRPRTKSSPCGSWSAAGEK